MCTLVEGTEDDGLGVRPLHGDEGSVFGLVEEFGIGARGLVTQKGLQPFLQCCDHGRSVRGVGDDEELFVSDPVGDEVIEEVACLVDEHTVLGLADLHLRVLRHERVVEECRSVGAGEADFAHVGEVEDACGFAHGTVLSQFGPVLQRHVPAAEVGEGCAQLGMDIVQRSLSRRILSTHQSSSSSLSSKASGGGQLHTRLRSP